MAITLRSLKTSNLLDSTIREGWLSCRNLDSGLKQAIVESQMEHDVDAVAHYFDAVERVLLTTDPEMGMQRNVMHRTRALVGYLDAALQVGQPWDDDMLQAVAGQDSLEPKGLLAVRAGQWADAHDATKGASRKALMAQWARTADPTGRFRSNHNEAELLTIALQAHCEPVVRMYSGVYTQTQTLGRPGIQDVIANGLPRRSPTVFNEMRFRSTLSTLQDFGQPLHGVLSKSLGLDALHLLAKLTPQDIKHKLPVLLNLGLEDQPDPSGKTALETMAWNQDEEGIQAWLAITRAHEAKRKVAQWLDDFPTASLGGVKP